MLSQLRTQNSKLKIRGAANSLECVADEHGVGHGAGAAGDGGDCGGFLGDLSSGILYLMATWLGYNQPDMAGHVYDYGTKFLVSAGLLNVLAMTPVMLAEYVPADFDTQQRQTSEEALAIVARESGIEAPRISYVVRQGGIYHEILEEAAAMKADLIVMTSHRPAMRTYFLGSNAGHVVRYAKCSVLVVRH